MFVYVCNLLCVMCTGAVLMSCWWPSCYSTVSSMTWLRSNAVLCWAASSSRRSPRDIPGWLNSCLDLSACYRLAMEGLSFSLLPLAVAGLEAWNHFPLDVRSKKSSLKTFLFHWLFL